MYMEDRVILVTGSSRGIGANLVENFAKKHWRVVINYSRSQAEASALADRITRQSGSGRVLTAQADVRRRKDVKDMFDAACTVFGRVDVLVNNAGINMDGPFLDMTSSQWSSVLDTILLGAFNCSQEFAGRYAGDSGHIVNIGAVTGISGRRNGANYCTARAGILAFTKCLALELAPKICVNTVTPGYINTEEVMKRRSLHIPENLEKAISAIPAGRLGTPDDIFNAVHFLVCGATYVTGQNLSVDGGYLMR